MFIPVMITFTIGMALLPIDDINARWIWYIYFLVWTLIELEIAKNIRLKWWHWALIVLSIFGVNYLVLFLVEYFKSS